MATAPIHGVNAKITAGSLSSASVTVTKWTLKISRDMIDVTPMGTTIGIQRTAGLLTWTAEIETPMTTSEAIIALGSSVSVAFYPATGDDYISGTAIVSDLNIVQNPDDVSRIVYKLQGISSLTWNNA